MKDKGISTLKVAATYIGTVVGAGFATGQEIPSFLICLESSVCWSNTSYFNVYSIWIPYNEFR